MDDLTSATQLGKGSLYGAFGDKHQLYLRVLDDYCAARIADAEQALTGSDESARDRLEAYVRRTVTASLAGADRGSCLMSSAASELANSDAAVTTRLRETFERIEDLLVLCVEGAQRAGDVKAADARQLGRMLLGVQRGMEALGSAGSDVATLADIADGALAALG
jgi:TetR/AcrR family transcriptional repressor of nem operon